jgi:hypothetical protein
MSDDLQYRVDDLLISVRSSSLLVIVRRTGRPSGIDQFWELPEWVFTSRHVIWLSDEDLNVNIRARQGEQIKEWLMARWRQAS